jgi:hypothetical protein
MEDETMQPITVLELPTRELAQRVNDGVEVTLLWSERDGRLAVVVFNHGTGEFFELEAPRDRALDVFYHPFFYAAYGAPASPGVEVPA